MEHNDRFRASDADRHGRRVQRQDPAMNDNNENYNLVPAGDITAANMTYMARQGNDGHGWRGPDARTTAQYTNTTNERQYLDNNMSKEEYDAAMDSYHRKREQDKQLLMIRRREIAELEHEMRLARERAQRREHAKMMLRASTPEAKYQNEPNGIQERAAAYQTEAYASETRSVRPFQSPRDSVRVTQSVSQADDRYSGTRQDDRQPKDQYRSTERMRMGMHEQWRSGPDGETMEPRRVERRQAMQERDVATVILGH
jgi:hypothetical protein